MPTPRCIKNMVDAMQGQLSDAEAARLLQKMVATAKTRAAKRSIPIADAVREIAGEIKVTQQNMRAISERNALLSAKAILSVEKFVKKGKDWGGETFRVLSRTHDEAMGLSLRYQERLIDSLDRKGLFDAFKKGDVSLDFFRESWELSKGADGNPGLTGNKPALEIAKIWKDLRTETNSELNKWGAWIKDVPGYVMTQTHDQRLIRKDGGGGWNKRSMSKAYSTWKSFMDGLNIDWERTYTGPDKEAFLKNFHENIYTGVHGGPNDELDPEAFQAHGALASRISKQRVLWFADPDSQWKYNQRYGIQDFNEAIKAQLNSRSRQIALLKNFGPNPDGNFTKLVGRLKEDASHLDDSEAQVKSLNAPSIQGGMDWLLGRRGVTANPQMSDFFDNLKQFTHLSKLGSFILSQFSDKAFFQQEMAHQGVGALERFGAQLDAFKKAGPSGDAVSKQLGFYAHSRLGQIASQWGEDVRGSTLLKKGLDKMISIQGAERWTLGHKRTMAEMAAHLVGEESHLPWNQLSEQRRAILSHFDISDPEWNVVRSGVQTVEDFKVVTPDSIRNVPDAVVHDALTARGEAITPANADRLKSELEGKFNAYLIDSAERAIPTPGLQEKELMTRGGQRGTISREMAGLFWMFKGFPLSAALKTLGRARDVNSDFAHMPWISRPNRMMIPALIAEATVLGYMSMWAKDALNLRTRRSLLDDNGAPNWHTVLGAMQRGGGLGIYGDFLFSEYDSRTHDFLGAAAGPVLGQLAPAAALVSKARAAMLGDEKSGESLGYDAFKFADQNTPFIGMLGFRSVLDYLVMWNVREMLSPGVLRRTQQSIEQKNGQTFYVDPVRW